MTEQEVVARTIWGEARGEGREGMAAVACVVRNRAWHPRYWGRNFTEVCQRHAQFSCWNTADPNYEKMLAVTSSDPQYSAALIIAMETIAGRAPDVTHGADHYADLALDHPAWADPKQVTAVIRRHTFFRLELAAPEQAVA